MTDQENLENQTAERNYIAFISYRHKPLDMAIAKKLHQRIERYVIPKELRKRGASADERKLGLVFRDQDELPIANNLTDNIRMALDHAKFLIVVCSPDTPESVWVQREISYFLEHHDRDHLLAILIDGDPERSFPSQLTEVRDEEGNLIDQIEPLAANIVADSERARNRLFRTESLRILASLIGCPFDALYQREHRYQMRRLGIAATAGALIAAGFIGMLLNRNAMIKEQLRESMINESKALAALSDSAYRDGDYRGALEYALDALPGRNPGRPYVAEAENALSPKLDLYDSDGTMSFSQSFDQNTEIVSIALSPDGSRIATGDRYGNVSVSDMESGRLLWSAKTKSTVYGLYFVKDVLLANNGAGEYSVFSSEGELIRREDQDAILYVDTELGMSLSYVFAGSGLPAHIMDVSTGEVLYDLGAFDSGYYMTDRGTISPDGRYCAILECYPGNQGADLYVYDLKAGERKLIRKDLMNALALANYNLDFDGDGNLVLTFCGFENLLSDREEYKGNYVTLFERASDWSERFTTYLDFGSAQRKAYGGIDISDYMDFMKCTESGIIMASRNRLIMVDGKTGATLWSKDLPERVRSAKIYPGGGVMGMILGDGMITMCTLDKGTLSCDVYLMYYNCDFDVYGGAISGEKLMGANYVVVPSRIRTRATVVSVQKNDHLQSLPWADKIPESAHFLASPSGNSTVAVVSGDSDDVHVYYQDDPDGSSPKEISAEGVRYNDSTGALYNAAVTDTGKLILGGRIYDIDSKSVKSLTISGGTDSVPDTTMSASCTDSSGQKVITASIEEDSASRTFMLGLWEDGVFTGRSSQVPGAVMMDGDDTEGTDSTAGADGAASTGDTAGADSAATADEATVTADPEGLDYFATKEELAGELWNCECRAVSAMGYVVVCGQTDVFGGWKYAVYDSDKDMWAQLENMSDDEEAALALGEKHPWLAAQKEDGTLSITDLTSGKEVLSAESTLPGESIVKLIFAEDDEWMLAFTGTGALAIYSTKDGKELHYSTYSDHNLRFKGNARYTVYHLAKDNRILILYDDINYTEANAIVIDTASMKATGFHPAITLYYPSSETVLVKHDHKTACISRLFTVDEMQEIAEELLGNRQNPEE